MYPNYLKNTKIFYYRNVTYAIIQRVLAGVQPLIDAYNTQQQAQQAAARVTHAANVAQARAQGAPPPQLPPILQIPDNDAPTLTTFVSNNNFNISAGYIEHSTSKLIIQQIFENAYPHPRTGVQQTRLQTVNDLSLYLQQPTWPTCVLANVGACSPPTLTHRPDVAVLLLERPATRPLPGQGSIYRIPILLVEVEGGKDVWGASEQESKAMEELIHSLAFVEQNYCLFVYNNRWEFWEGKRNETTSMIDITSEIIWIQNGGNVYETKMDRILDLIIMALVKQLVSGEVTIAAQVAAYRAKNCSPQVETHGDFDQN